ncbi:30S ribosomal protein S1 [Candidatus Margulisiibacteriota bacterium]
MAMEDLEGTNISKGKESIQDIDDLIKETLAETKKEAEIKKEKAQKEEAIKEKAAATPLEPKKEEPGYSATPIKKEPPKETPAQGTPISIKKEPQKEEMYEATFKSYKQGDIVKGKVLKIDPSGVLVDIKYKADGLIKPDELTDNPSVNPGDVVKEGDIIDVLIERLEDKEGYVTLSKRKAEYETKWQAAYDAYKGRKVIEGKVTGAVKGGLIIDYNGIRGFIPASQVASEAKDKLDSLVGQSLPIKIIEINKRQGKVVLSHKIATSEKQRFDAGKVIDQIEVGQVKKGTVTSLKKFGAFVDIGGVEGLIHLSELSWRRVNHPSDVLKTGDEIDVFVLGVDKETKKVALGLKELQDDPWVKAGELYKAGQIVKCKIARFVKFGAFVDLDGGLEGLVHISELSANPVANPEDAVKVGDVVEAKVLRVLPAEQKIGLSIKQVAADKEKKEIKKHKEKEEQDKKKVTIGDVMKDKKEKAKEEEEE